MISHGYTQREESCTQLYNIKAPNASIGASNALVSNIGSNSNLAAVASRIGLKNFIITNPGHCGPISQGMLATAMEAVLGAIYLDCGKDMTSMKSVMSALDLKAS